MAKSLNVKFHPVDGELGENLKVKFVGNSDGFIKSDPGGLFMTPGYLNICDEIYNMPLRPSDVWVLTFPKSGTTWMQELVWLLLNELDFDGATKESIETRSPFLEYIGLLPESTNEADISRDNHLLEVTTIFDANNATHNTPRVLKSHLPFYTLPKDLLEKNKVIYVARNPRDVIVSYYHHHILIKIQEFTGTFKEFFNYFLNDEVLFSPYWPHILDAYSKRSHSNMCFVFYEDMKKDLKSVIRKIASFLDKPVSETDVDKLCMFLQFNNFKQRWDVFESKYKQLGLFKEGGSFLRKGEIGDHKNYFDAEMEERMDKWVKTHLHESDLTFPK